MVIIVVFVFVIILIVAFAFVSIRADLVFRSRNAASFEMVVIFYFSAIGF